MNELTQIEVQKAKVSAFRVVARPVPVAADGEVVMRVDRFAVTANNVTYAVFGEAMKYWNFFPASEPDWGIVPVWGFADVIESSCADVVVGERFYGYFPMASHIVLQPAKVTPAGFFDGVAHRRELHSVYNNYVRIASDPSYLAEREAEQMLLRPLFTTSFLIDDFLEDSKMFGAQSIVLSSASSKTAYGAAFCLHQRGSVRVVGITSERNRPFTEALGCYDQVLTYDEIPSLAVEPTAYVDLAGSATARLAIHTVLGDALLYDCGVGGTHWDDIGGSSTMPGPRPQMFFAPAQVAKRTAEWGAAGFADRLSTAWTSFLSNVVAAENPWMRVESVNGSQAVAECFVAQANGSAKPEIGYIAQV